MTPGSVDKDFIDLVAQDVRGLLRPSQRVELYSDENLDRLYDALISLKKDVEVQLCNQRSRAVKKQHELNQFGDDGSGWKAYQASEADWRARAIKFLKAVEDHIAAAKTRRRELHRHHPISDELLDAVLAHMEEIDPEQASPADKRVWDIARKLTTA